MRLVRIEDVTEIKPFDCGDSELNEFLFKDAVLYRQEMIANTFIMEDDFETIAYFSLLNDKITKTDLDKNLWRRLRSRFSHRKHLKSYPAVKIGRLAVSSSHRNKGIGSEIILYIQKALFEQQSIAATRFLTVDAYQNAVTFYKKNNFLPLINNATNNTLPMYCDLKSLIR